MSHLKFYALVPLNMCSIILWLLGTAANATASNSMITSALPRRAASGMTNCDGVGTFTCPTGTCYTGYDGFVGCCSVSSCAARTTCIPYAASGTQTCDSNTGGCIGCSQALPSCATITNIAASQYIMYCDVRQQVVTYSYINLITTGSMAFPPTKTISPTSRPPSSSTAASVSSSSPATSTLTEFSVSSAAQVSATMTTTPAIVSSSSSPDLGSQGHISAGAVAGISIGSGAAVLLAIAALISIWKKRNHAKNQSNCEKFEGSGRPGTFKGFSNAHNTLSTNSNDKSDYLSPIEYDRCAQLAEADDTAQINELDNSVSTRICSFPNVETHNSETHGWEPSATNPLGEARLSSRWSANNASTMYKPYRDGSIDKSVPELSGAQEGQFSSSSDAIPVMPATLPAAGYVVSPMVGGDSPQVSSGDTSTTPQINQRNGDELLSTTHQLRPTATLDGPINWPSSQHIGSSSHSRSSHQGMSRSLTNATGGGGKYVSPELAMTEGFS